MDDCGARSAPNLVKSPPRFWGPRQIETALVDLQNEEKGYKQWRRIG
jgi:hypothetical protein